MRQASIDCISPELRVVDRKSMYLKCVWCERRGRMEGWNEGKAREMQTWQRLGAYHAGRT
jgi:hypothetical protein